MVEAFELGNVEDSTGNGNYIQNKTRYKSKSLLGQKLVEMPSKDGLILK